MTLCTHYQHLHQNQQRHPRRHHHYHSLWRVEGFKNDVVVQAAPTSASSKPKRNQVNSSQTKPSHAKSTQARRSQTKSSESGRAMFCHNSSRYVISVGICHVVSCRLVGSRVRSPVLVSCRAVFVMPCHVISLSCNAAHIMPCHGMSFHFMSFPVTRHTMTAECAKRLQVMPPYERRVWECDLCGRRSMTCASLWGARDDDAGRVGGRDTTNNPPGRKLNVAVRHFCDVARTSGRGICKAFSTPCDSKTWSSGGVRYFSMASA